MGNPRKLAIVDTYNSTKTNKTTNKQNKTQKTKKMSDMKISIKNHISYKSRQYLNKGNTKITELRTILQRESKNS